MRKKLILCYKFSDKSEKKKINNESGGKISFKTVKIIKIKSYHRIVI